MKAVQIHQFGGLDELKYEEAPKPVIAPDEVLIKVFASGVNPIDWKVRKGYMKDRVSYTFPLIPGWDVSGQVEEVGKHVKQFKIGDEVYGRPDTTRNGSYAEYIAVRESELSYKPKSIDHVHSAAVPLAGLTAWQGLIEHGKLQQAQKVLIQGGSGGVGTYAVQIAKWKGAKVFATASEKNTEFLKELGADQVIDYHKTDLESKLHDIDVVFDLIGGDTQLKLAKTLKKNGILVSTVGITNQDAIKQMGIYGVSYMAKSTPSDLQQLASLIDQGKLKPIVSKVFPLKNAKEAQELSEEGHTKGKIVLKIAE